MRLFKSEVLDTGEQSFMIKFTKTLGNVVERATKIKATDAAVIRSKVKQQRAAGVTKKQDGKKVRFSSDTEITHYEIFVLSRPPGRIEDFSQGEHYRVDANDMVWPFVPEPNVEKYMIFRSADANGFSNPTEIFKFKYNVYGDGTYYEFDIYEIERNKLENLISFERFLSIAPNSEQRLVKLNTLPNTGTGDTESYDMSTAPTKHDLDFDRTYQKEEEFGIKNLK